MSDTAKSRMDRIIRLHEEIDSIKADIREVYAEEKADGGDKTAMGAAISIIRKREKDRTAFDDQEAMVGVYLNAYASPSHTHAREAGQSYAEAKGGSVEIKGFKATISAEASAAIHKINVPAHDAETGEILTQEQPVEPASQSGHANEVRTDALRSSDVGKLSHDASAPAESASDEISAPIPHSVRTSSLASDNAGEVAPPASPAPIPDSDVPAFLRRDVPVDVTSPDFIKLLRPFCQNLDDCHGHGRECSKCKAARAA